MVSFNNRQENVSFKRKNPHIIFIGDKPVPGVTSVIQSMQTVKLNLMLQREKHWKSTKSKFELFTKEKTFFHKDRMILQKDYWSL
jgi:hypothetical protein